MSEKIKPYVILIPKSKPKYFVALDRSYTWIPEKNLDTNVDMSRMVENNVFEGYPYLSRPVADYRLNYAEEIFIGIWFDYYD